MKLPAAIKNALIETMIKQYVETNPSSRTIQGQDVFSIPFGKILEATEMFSVSRDDIRETLMANPGSLNENTDSDAVIYTAPFTRECDKYEKCLDYIKENTASNSKFAIEYDPAIRESLIYNFFSGFIVLMVPEEMKSLSQLRFALLTGGSKLRAIIDKTGGWIYVFPKYIMESMECGKTPADTTNVNNVIASYLEDIFPDN